MCDNVNNNPFAGLFSTVNDAVSFSSQNQGIVNESDKVSYVAQLEAKDVDNITGSKNIQDSKDHKIDSHVNRYLGDIFGITLHRTEVNEEAKRRLIFVNIDSIEQAVFERLMLSDLESKLVPLGNCQQTLCDSHVTEKRVLLYLFESFCRLERYRNKLEFSDIFCKIQQVILQNASVALQEPEFFEKQSIYNQFIELFANESESQQELASFVNGIVFKLEVENGTNAVDAISASFRPVLDTIYKLAIQTNLVLYPRYWFAILNLFSSIEPLAKLVIGHNAPENNQGRAYADTLLGALLNLSCLPRNIEEPFYFFERPLQQASGLKKRGKTVSIQASSSIRGSIDSMELFTYVIPNLTIYPKNHCLKF